MFTRCMSTGSQNDKDIEIVITTIIYTLNFSPD